MQFLVIVGSGVVTTYFGPFETKAEVKAWAQQTDQTQYVVVVMYPPYLGEKPG
jgi:hypothetical protein